MHAILIYATGVAVMRLLANATATLLAPVASAHEPTNTSTAPYPNLPNRPPNDDAPAPASSSNPEATGPTITETLRASDIP